MTTSDELWAAVETFDAEAAEIAIAKLLWDVPLSGAVTGVVLPFLQEVGDRWEAGTISVAHEHFVSDMLRRTLTKCSWATEIVPASQRSPTSCRKGSTTPVTAPDLSLIHI